MEQTQGDDGKILCPICSIKLIATEFGVCRSRKTGRNLYCKGCVRKKVTQSRQDLKDFRKKQKELKDSPPPNGNGDNSTEIFWSSLSRLTPVERVREAIRKGARTQKDIAVETKLGKDEIGDALANLLLWTREVKFRGDADHREYFLNPDIVTPVKV